MLATIDRLQLLILAFFGIASIDDDLTLDPAVIDLDLAGSADLDRRYDGFGALKLFSDFVAHKGQHSKRFQPFIALNES